MFIRKNKEKTKGETILKYLSTRGTNEQVSSSLAILQGIAKDGGLFVPTEIPKIDKTLEQLSKLSYNKLAYEILKLYLTDFTEAELVSCIENAYNCNKFDNPLIAPLVQKDEYYFLELFHGRTLAFKDVALSILPHFMKTAAAKNGYENGKDEIVILTATSGDTGKAAIEGFADVEGTKIVVFFPENGVSPIQKLQMTTSEGKNVRVVGVLGNFDDTQTGVKKIFAQNPGKYSSANSINIGRLVPQIVYYFHGYFQMAKSGAIELGQPINFTVPTGNFGNILAGYYAKEMGLPINKLICASNENKILYDFFTTGTYDKNREFFITTSPSMDILVSSNLERLIYHTLKDGAKTKELMGSLLSNGNYNFSMKNELFTAQFANSEEGALAINKLYSKCKYVIDTHTAVALASYNKFKEQNDNGFKNIIVSTASPFKFPEAVCTAIDKKQCEGKNSFELMEVLSHLENTNIPEQVKNINKREVKHSTVCKVEEMTNNVIF